MPPRSRRSRAYDPAKTRAALLAQARSVLAAVRGLEPPSYDLPTRLGDRTVSDLVVHIAAEVEAVSRTPGQQPPAAAPAGPAARLAAAIGALEAGADGPAGIRPGALVDLVVHSDDLTAATGLPVPLDRQALATAVRLLADTLAEQAPGNAVELRIPPYAAVQCVEGPRHTRGTPPNVVETDPVTWLRLACGRIGWAAAVADAAVSASGERADLSAHLPVPGFSDRPAAR